MWIVNKEELRKINVEEIMTQIYIDPEMRDGVYEYLGRNGFDERTAKAEEFLRAVMDMYDAGLFYKE